MPPSLSTRRLGVELDAPAPRPTNDAALFFGARGRFSRTQAWAGLAMCVFLHLVGSSTFSLFGSALRAQGIGVLYWPTTGSTASSKSMSPTSSSRSASAAATTATGAPGGWRSVTGIGIPVLAFELGLLRGTIGPNRFGPDPLQDTDAIRRVFESSGKGSSIGS